MMIAILLSELPPRARRIPPPRNNWSLRSGTTSACAENTKASTHLGEPSWNYLRVRGEYFPAFVAALFTGELPPRARRIPHNLINDQLRLGTTSACAENTPPTPHDPPSPGNYLRVRGEYLAGNVEAGERKELPPRARRIPGPALGAVMLGGTTSACAENTARRRPHRPRFRNYLRVRGEYPLGGNAAMPRSELPPRARRIRSSTPAWYSCSGTTSACAENTPRGRFQACSCRNYLRVRGEYSNKPSPISTCMELPPRARRIPV